MSEHDRSQIQLLHHANTNKAAYQPLSVEAAFVCLVRQSPYFRRLAKIAKIAMAPNVDAIQPAGCPMAYQPIVCPTQLASTEPPMPSNVVTMMPKHCPPGYRNLAKIPMMKPMMMVLIMVGFPLMVWIGNIYIRQMAGFSRERLPEK